MENISSSPVGLTTSSNRTIGELLHIPFEPVTIYRPMKLFKGTLGLTINQKDSPNPEFLVRLITSYPSHQAMIRDHAGGQFKNFTHYIRGQYEVSQTTLRLLCQNFGITLEELQNLQHKKDDGPLLPEILECFYWVEGFYQKVYKALTYGEVLCKHCNSNIMNDTKAWWSLQNMAVDPPEYQFLERILSVIVGGTFIYNFFNNSTNNSKVIKASNLGMMNHRPIGNWLAVVMQAYECTNLKEFAEQLQIKGIDISHELLKKWSSEQILIPLADADTIIKDLPNKGELFAMLLISRSLALSVDFLRSSIRGTTYIQHRIAQKVIFESVKRLDVDALLFSTAMEFASDDDTAFGKTDFFTNLCLYVPASLFYGWCDVFSTYITF